MKNLLFCGLSVTLIASVVGAAEVRGLRSAAPTSVAPTLLTQSNGVGTPALSPTPDPLYTPSLPSQVPSLPSPAVQSHTVQYPPNPVPEQGPLYPIPAQGYPVSAQPVELFSDVRYHATRNIAPCAVPCIVQIPDPCNRDKCCKTCVNVQICVPPCDPKAVCVTRDGNRVRYDFGKYAVVVKTVGDHVCRSLLGLIAASLKPEFEC